MVPFRSLFGRWTEYFPDMSALHGQRSAKMNGPNVNSCVFFLRRRTHKSQRGSEPAFRLSLSWLTGSRLKTNRVLVQTPVFPHSKQIRARERSEAEACPVFEGHPQKTDSMGMSAARPSLVVSPPSSADQIMIQWLARLRQGIVCNPTPFPLLISGFVFLLSEWSFCCYCWITLKQTSSTFTMTLFFCT